MVKRRFKVPLEGGDWSEDLRNRALGQALYGLKARGSVQEAFGVSNGVRERGYKWLLGGHVDPTSLKMDDTVLMYESGPAVVFLATCVASLRASDYKVRFIFLKTTKSIVAAPGSHCECAAGNLFCGHILAFFLRLHCIQTNYGDKIPL